MVTVRAATPQDAADISDLCAEIQDLHHQALPKLFKPGSGDTFSRGEIKALMSEPKNYFYVAEVEGVTAGYVYATRKQIAENSFQYAFDQLHIDQIGVHPPYRGQGCGQALIKTIKNLAASQNITFITLSTWGFNRWAHTFFASQGFEAFLHDYWYWVNQPG